MAGSQLRLKLIGRIDGWIDVSAKPFLRSRQGFTHLLKGGISDDKQVDIAGGTEPAADG